MIRDEIGFRYVTDERGLESASHSAMSVALSQREPCHIICLLLILPQPALTFASVLERVQATLTFHTIGSLAVERHQTGLHVGHSEWDIIHSASFALGNLC
jgi:hypothetical protein